jgi:hypothetical protein
VRESHFISFDLQLCNTKHNSAAAARELLRTAPGVIVIDDPAAKAYPMPITGRCEV